MLYANMQKLARNGMSEKVSDFFLAHCQKNLTLFMGIAVENALKVSDFPSNHAQKCQVFLLAHPL